MNNAVILLRVSSDLQDNEVQRQECVKYAKDNDLSVLQILESKQSAYKNTMDDLENIQTILSYAKDGLIDNLVFYKADRVGRNISFISFFEQMSNYNVTLHSVTEGILKANSSMDMLQIVLRLFAGQTETESISIRVKDTLKTLNEQTFTDEEGNEIETVIAGRLPYGCIMQDTGIVRNIKKGTTVKRIVLDEEIKPLIRKMFDMYIYEDKGSSRIANWLNKESIPTPTKRGKWTNATVNRILLNSVYTGKLRYHVIEFVDSKSKKRKRLDKSEWKYKEMPQLRIITDEEFQKVHELAEARRTRKGEIASRGSDNVLLNNLCYCKYCGMKMYITSSKKFNKERGWYRLHYYCCRKTHNESAHEQSSYSAPIIDEAVVNRLLPIIEQHVSNVEFDSNAHNNKIIKDVEKEVNKLLTTLEDKELELKTLESELPKALVNKSDFSPKLLSRLISGLEEEVASLNSELLTKRSQLKRIKSDVDSVQKRLDIFVNFDKLWSNAITLDDKKSLLRTIIKEIRLSKGNIDIELKLHE